MPIDVFEIRVCESCGLRYPIPVTGHDAKERCPDCQGATRLILSQNMIIEPGSISPKKNYQARNISVILDNVRSAWNVGSIFRTANGFGYSHIYLCGITPTPANNAVKKTSLGAEDSVPWSYHKDAVSLATEIRANGSRLIALEEHEQATSLKDAHKTVSENSTVLIVGNEITGVDPHLLDLCHKIYQIPMQGDKKSFNVAIAFSIASYALADFYN